ncbi:MAG: RNA polymerase sigma factor [bacterium]
MESKSDSQLVRDFRLGVLEAFETLYHRYKQPIYSFCLRLTGERQTAEDATHDAFLKVYQHIDSLQDVTLFKSWLYSIARNQVYKSIRKTKSNGVLDEGSVWSEETPLTILQAEETKQIISTSLNALKAEYLEVLLLKEFEKLSYAEISVITGDSVSSVKSRLFKARKALAEHIEKFYSD